MNLLLSDKKEKLNSESKAKWSRASMSPVSPIFHIASTVIYLPWHSNHGFPVTSVNRTSPSVTSILTSRSWSGTLVRNTVRDEELSITRIDGYVIAINNYVLERYRPAGMCREKQLTCWNNTCVYEQLWIIEMFSSNIKIVGFAPILWNRSIRVCPFLPKFVHRLIISDN